MNNQHPVIDIPSALSVRYDFNHTQGIATLEYVLNSGSQLSLVSFNKETNKVSVTPREAGIVMSGSAWQFTLNSLRRWVGLVHDEFELTAIEEGRSVVFGQFPPTVVLVDIQIKIGTRIGNGLIVLNGNRQEDTVEVEISPRPSITCSIEELVSFIRLAQLHLTALVSFETLHPETI